MASSDRIVRLVLTGESAGAVRALKSVEDASARTTSKLEENNRRGSESFSRMHDSVHRLRGSTALLAGAAGLGALAYSVVDVTRSAIGMQSQTAQLQNALRNTGVTGTAAFNQMTAAASNMAVKGGFAAQENIQALTQFTRISGNAAQATRMFALATNVARGAHKDLLPVTKALALAEQGRLTGLSRMGIVLPKGATPQQAMAMLQSRYGGAAAAFSNTAAGGMSNLKQGWDVIKEDLGKAFLPLVVTLSKTFSSLMPQIQRVLNSLVTPLAAILQGLLPPLVGVLQTVMPPLVRLINAVMPVMAKAVTSALLVL